MYYGAHSASTRDTNNDINNIGSTIVESVHNSKDPKQIYDDVKSVETNSQLWNTIKAYYEEIASIWNETQAQIEGLWETMFLEYENYDNKEEIEKAINNLNKLEEIRGKFIIKRKEI